MSLADTKPDKVKTEASEIFSYNMQLNKGESNIDLGKHHPSRNIGAGGLYTKLTRKISNRKYTPEPNGAKEYFADTIASKGSINLLAVGELGNLAVTTYYLESFIKSTHDEMIDSTGTEMKVFKEFLVRCLMNFQSTKNHGARANYTTEVQDEMDNMRADWAQTLTAQVAALQVSVYSQSDTSPPGEPAYQDVEATKVKDFQDHITVTKTDPQGGQQQQNTTLAMHMTNPNKRLGGSESNATT
eukprot:jgi/Psemu1/42249/gm1.42249_g